MADKNAGLNRSLRVDGKTQASGGRTCFNCGMYSHLDRNCPYPKQKGDKEAKSKKPPGVATIEANTDTKPRSQISELRQKLH